MRLAVKLSLLLAVAVTLPLVLVLAVLLPRGGAALEQLLVRADASLYDAKASGRDRVA